MINFLKKTNYKIDNFLNKLLKDLDLICLDFSKTKSHVISISLINIQLGLKKKKIKLKQNLKITIVKNSSSQYVITQKDFDFSVTSDQLNDGLKKFQTDFFLFYQDIKKKKNLNSKENELNALFDTIF